MTISHIVFDIGNTLIEGYPERIYFERIPDPAARKRFLAEVCTPEWHLEQDRGRSWEDAEAVLITKYPEEADLIRAYRANFWNDLVVGEISGTVAIFDELLSLAVDVTGLTNWASDTWAETPARFPLVNRFRGVTVSSHIGLIKPDPAIFRHHAVAFYLDPDATLLIDDSLRNVEGAKAVGWSALHYTDPAHLRVDLRRHGFPLR
jgi:2-haloacid dehalogenase